MTAQLVFKKIVLNLGSRAYWKVKDVCTTVCVTGNFNEFVKIKEKNILDPPSEKELLQLNERGISNNISMLFLLLVQL